MTDDAEPAENPVEAVFPPATGEALIVVAARWALPRRLLEPTTSALAAAGVTVLDADTDADTFIAERLRVVSLPTWLWWVDGYEQQRIVGAVSPAELWKLCGREAPSSGRAKASRRR